MTPFRTHPNCTERRDPGAEKLLETVIPEIAGEIAAAIPRLAGVCLGGGYGRGEGGVRRHPDGSSGLYNDLDFFVFTRRASGRERAAVDRALEPVSRKWGEQLGVEVDFSPARNAGTLAAVQDRLMFQELKYGHWQILGADDVLAALPQLRADGLSRLEGARLLLNRGVGLLLAGEALARPSPDPGFVARNLNKAVLGAGDALLIADRRYRWRAWERRMEFASLVVRHGLPERHAERYARALEFKFLPDESLYREAVPAWRDIRDFWYECLCLFAGVPPEVSTPILLRRLRQMRFGRTSGLANALRWLCKAPALGHPARLFDVPLMRVLAEAAEILPAADPVPGGFRMPPSLVRKWLAFQ